MHETDERPEYIKMMHSEVICKSALRIFGNHNVRIQRLSYSVNTLKWAVLFDTIAVVFLFISNLLKFL